MGATTKPMRAELAPGLSTSRTVHRNLVSAELYEAALTAGEGQVAAGGAFCAITTPHTGRSPNDKFVVRESETEKDIWWGKVNAEMSPEHWDALHKLTLDYLAGQDQLHVQVIRPNGTPFTVAHSCRTEYGEPARSVSGGGFRPRRAVRERGSARGRAADYPLPGRPHARVFALGHDGLL